MIQEAQVHGVSTRKVDDLVQALGVSGVSRSEVSRVWSVLGEGTGYDKGLALIPGEVIAFVQATQRKPWDKLQALPGDKSTVSSSKLSCSGCAKTRPRRRSPG